MNGTDDRLEQALAEDAQRWRDDFAPPALATAMARLDLGDQESSAAPARMPRGRGWWRPLAVAAAVLLVVGGVVGLLRRGVVSPIPPGTSASGPVSVPLTYVDRGGDAASEGYRPGDRAGGRPLLRGDQDPGPR